MTATGEPTVLSRAKKPIRTVALVLNPQRYQSKWVQLLVDYLQAQAWKLIFAIVSDITPHDRKRWSLHFREKLLLAVPLAPLSARDRAIQLGENHGKKSFS